MKNTLARRALAAGFALAAATTLAACGDDAERDDASNEITAAGDADVFDLEVGDCFDDTDSGQITDVPGVPCAEPHDNEIFHTFEMEEGDWPGNEAVSAAADEECNAAFEEFVGIAYDDSTLYWSTITPVQQTWEEIDDREVICVIYSPDGPTEGTLEGSQL
ncbi:septum formation family protein [Nocardioides zeae]